MSPRDVLVLAQVDYSQNFCDLQIAVTEESAIPYRHNFWHPFLGHLHATSSVWVRIITKMIFNAMQHNLTRVPCSFHYSTWPTTYRGTIMPSWQHSSSPTPSNGRVNIFQLYGKIPVWCDLDLSHSNNLVTFPEHVVTRVTSHVWACASIDDWKCQ